MLTSEGAAHFLRVAAGQSTDPITRVRVSSTSDQAAVDVASLDVIPEAGGAILRVRAIFGEDVANFDWLRREVVTRDGVVIDLDIEDRGRKVLGAIWDVEVDINVAATAVVD